jgi:hypothetical protein
MTDKQKASATPATHGDTSGIADATLKEIRDARWTTTQDDRSNGDFYILAIVNQILASRRTSTLREANAPWKASYQAANRAAQRMDDALRSILSIAEHSGSSDEMTLVSIRNRCREALAESPTLRAPEVTDELEATDEFGIRWRLVPEEEIGNGFTLQYKNDFADWQHVVHLPSNRTGVLAALLSRAGKGSSTPEIASENVAMALAGTCPGCRRLMGPDETRAGICDECKGSTTPKSTPTGHGAKE